jgi:leucyl aminopeptidase
LKYRSSLEFGEKFYCYGIQEDCLYLCISEKKNTSDQKWVELGKECHEMAEKNNVITIEMKEKDCEEINLEKFLEGIYISNYDTGKYKSNKCKKIISVTIPEKYFELHRKAEKISAAIHVAMDICNEPANVMYPRHFAELLNKLFTDTDVNVEIIKSNELNEKQFYAVEQVGKGSKNEPYVAVLTLKTNDDEPLALIGKGVTFDSGGVNAKTGSAIAEMKMDLGGAAAVTGAMKLLAETGKRCHVKAILPLVVNVGGGSAYLPSDVIKFRNGMTVEVGNTDAEGRLIIADSILYAQSLGIHKIIDIATLTGNVGQALGLKMAAVFSKDRNISNKVFEYGQKSGDYVWPMPLEMDYKDYLKSSIADLSNMSNSTFAGSITAALFIEHFVNKDAKWIHIDMANTSKVFLNNEGKASGFGTKLLYELVNARKEVLDD